MANDPSVSQRRYHPLIYIAPIVFLLALLGGSWLVAQSVVSARAGEARRVAFAATATSLALPTASFPPTPPQTIAPTLVLPATAVIPTVEDLHILATPVPQITLPPDAPPPMSLLPQHYQYDLVNFLVLGSDRLETTGSYRTDVMVIVSVNRTTQTVNLLSIPRDLYVYIPGWGMDRINTAELHQLQTKYSSHRLGLLAETIEYNLGIRIDHFARVDFTGFKALVDLLGGITVPVDCLVSGYRLASNGVDWVPFHLEPGIHHMDGSLALWYVRQRMDSSDFERNRRQQIVLRALWRQAASSDLPRNLPVIWDTLRQSLETDVMLDQALAFVPLVLGLDAARVESHFLGLDEVNLWRTPNGASVLVIDPEPFARTLNRFLTPPVENHLNGERATVSVLNASGLNGADLLAAAQLEWAGLLAFPQGPSSAPFAQTVVYDHTGQVKESSRGAIQTALGLSAADILLATDSAVTTDFTVVVGADYQSCQTSPWKPFSQPE